MRTRGEALETDTEEFRFETGLHVGVVLGENLVQTFRQQFAVAFALDGQILAAIMDPDVHDARILLGLPHCIGDASAALCVFDPEIANALVRIGKREIAGFRMRERSGIEVEF